MLIQLTAVCWLFSADPLIEKGTFVDFVSAELVRQEVPVEARACILGVLGRWIQERNRALEKKPFDKDAFQNAPYIPEFVWAAGSVGTIGHGAEIIQIVSDSEAICKCHDQTAFWISGLSTTGLADGAYLKLSDWLWRVKGQRQYVTAMSSQRTVHEIEPIGKFEEVKKYRDFFNFVALDKRYAKSLTAEKNKAKFAAAALEERELRNWSDLSGKFSIKARMKSAGMGQVKLIKEDGTELSVVIEKLSETDRKYIDDQKK